MREKTVTVRSATKVAEDRLAMYREIQMIGLILRPVLMRFDGKKITQRIETAVRAAFPKHHYNICLDATGSGQFKQFMLKIWGSQALPYNDRLTIYLKHAEDVVDFGFKAAETLEMFDYYEKWIEQLKKAPAVIPQIMKLRDEAVALIEQFKALAAQIDMDYDFDLYENN